MSHAHGNASLTSDALDSFDQVFSMIRGDDPAIQARLVTLQTILMYMRIVRPTACHLCQNLIIPMHVGIDRPFRAGK